MPFYLGFDTSNYKTSAAVYDSDSGNYIFHGKLLDIEKGKLGLRQSEAVFEHIKQLPALMENLIPETIKLSAIGASTRPRALDGSYMPCFKVGETTAIAVSSSMHLPFFAFSHQQGHLAAAALSADPRILKNPFLAWHLSGGTTELLYVEPDEKLIIKETIIGGTTDISAGQLIDRAGVMMGLKFPAGNEIDALSLKADITKGYKVRVNNCKFSLSGIENKIHDMQSTGTSNENIAYFALDTVFKAILTATKQAREQYGNLPLLCSGGVFANTMLREKLSKEPNVHFASRELSGDNAVGIAYLCSIVNEGGIK